MRAHINVSSNDDNDNSNNKSNNQTTVMDDALTNLSLERMRMVTKLNRRSLRAPEKSKHHNVTRRNQEVTGVSQCPSMCHMSALLLGRMSNSDPDDCTNT